MKYSDYNEELARAIDRLPVSEEMIPLYLNILTTTDNAVIRGEIAYKLSVMCPDNLEFKNSLIGLINSPKTNRAKGSLLYALKSMDYSDPKSIDTICIQLVEGNYECMYKAFHMLMDISDQINDESISKIIKYLKEHGEILGERLDLMEELYDFLTENAGNDSGS